LSWLAEVVVVLRCMTMSIAMVVVALAVFYLQRAFRLHPDRQ
jgi:hypothetical protein